MNNGSQTYLSPQRLIEEDIEIEAGNKPKKKGVAIKTRKSLAKDDGDFSAGFKPKKAATTASRKVDNEAAKSRTAASKAKVAAAAAVFDASDDDDDEEEAPPRKRISLNTKSEVSDSELMPPPPKPKPKPKAAAAPAKPLVKKAALKRKRYGPSYAHIRVTNLSHSEEMSGAHSDSETDAKPVVKKKQKTMEDFLGGGKIKSKTVKAPPAKKGKKKVDTEDEAELESGRSSPDVVSRTPPPKRATTSRAAIAKKPAYIELSDDDDDGGNDKTEDTFELSD